MKILHTADWHVGKTLHRRHRLEEVEAVLSEVVTVARNEEVDLVLVCGDIFDQSAPSADAERIVYSTLLGLRDTGAATVVLAGNHDNAGRFAAVSGLMGELGIQVAAEVKRPDEGGVIEIASRDGTETAQIAALPWVQERLLFGAEEMMGLQGEPQQAYAERLPRLITALCAELDDAAVKILAGHLFVSGSKLGGGERTLTIGDLFAIGGATLPTNVQYVALGHVHRPQDVSGSPVPTRYAGSLLQLDFGERSQKKSVSIVDVKAGKPPKTKEHGLKGGRKLVDVRSTLADLESHAGSEDSAFLRVFLECEGPQAGLADQVREILPNALEVRLEYPKEDAAARSAELRRLKPREIFTRYYKDRYGADPEKDLVKLFDDLLEEASDATAST